ncbi:MAG TPA: 2-succinyl-6-hydroxy-2,4-cyclohexadiene-1-carboxylate synthase, partial [Chloroflexota bacterium]|nr:2-succinyl-6-hydroxy-2,4-cyclohexadiene-1-carboxylate synthase [Chloroflexota bacterium]
MRVNATDLHVELDGGATLPPLLLLHGFTGSIRSWHGVRAQLARRYRLVLVDLIGHGQSAAPADPDRYSLDWCVRDLTAILDRLALQRVAVLGYSMGGRVAFRFTVDCPTRVSHLLLESASPGITDASERALRVESDRALADRLERDGISSFVDEWERQPLLALAPHVPEAVRVEQHAQRLANDVQGLANSLRGMGAGAQAPLWGSLGSLDMPVRILVGERDTRYCSIAMRMQSLMHQGKLTVCPEAG